MKTFTLLIFLLSISAFSQTTTTRKVDYDAIKVEILNDKSPYYFEKLKSRFIALDTTLTIDDFHYLYYGSSLKDNFNVNKRHTIDEKIKKYYNSEEITKEQWHEIVQYNEQIFKNDLFLDLNAFDILLSGYYYTDNMEKYNKLSNLFDKFLGAMIETGNGFSQATAMDVISTTHEYFIMNVLDFSVKGQSLHRDDEGRSYDFLAINYENDTENQSEDTETEENSESNLNKDSKLKGMYFDVTRLFELYAKMFN